MTGDTFDVRSSEILLKLKWETLEKRREEQMIGLVNKAFKSNVSSCYYINVSNYE